MSKKKSLKDKLTYAYLRRIKKWIFCPACQKGKMNISKKSTWWVCQECGYELSVAEFEDDYVFWFCDECNAYLNIQEGFDRNAKRHICKVCGYENDTTFDNLKGICSDCGTLLPDPDATLCLDCKNLRLKNAQIILQGVGEIVGVIAEGVVAANGGGESADETTVQDASDSIISQFAYVTNSWLQTASKDELYAVEAEMRAVVDSLDYDSDEYLQLDKHRIEVVNAIASRFPLNLPHREHGWYLPNGDD